MNKYWSNEDDKKVGYTSDQPPYQPRPDAGEREENDTPKAFSVGRRLDRYNTAPPPSRKPIETNQYGGDRSAFIAEEMNTDHKPGEMRFAPPPKFSETYGETYKPTQQGQLQFGDGYQVQSERTQQPHGKGHKKRGFVVFLIVLLVLALIGGGAYLFRHEILRMVGDVFGEEVMWKISPTAAPVEEAVDIPAYVEAAAPQAKGSAMQEIEAVTEGVALDTYRVTDENIVLRDETSIGGTYDYYVFSADSGRLLGYYEDVRNFSVCAQDIFYINEEPYLVTSAGYPLVNLEEYGRIAGADVVLYPMINQWAIIADKQGTTYNFVGMNGELISNLWFSKTFPFTADTTLGYVDTGNLVDPQTRYALYLLYQDGGTKRLDYMANTDAVLQCTCGMAFMQNGDMHSQDEDLTYVLHTDAAAAYVNCGALVVRDPDTQLYGLFVDGVQQYPFTFDSIEPMASDLQWTEYETGYVKQYAVTGETYPLPRSYSFVLKSGDTKQIVSIASASEYPIVFD